MDIANFDLYMRMAKYKMVDINQFMVKEFKDYMKVIESNNRRELMYSSNRRDVSDVVNNGIMLLDEFFPSLNRNVYYCNKFVAEMMCKDMNYMSPIAAVAYQKKFLHLLDSTDVPISVSDKKASGVDMAYGLYIDDYYLDRSPIIITGINLCSKQEVDMNVSYMHEQMHLLLGRNKGSVNDYLKTEVLSIFIEKVSALRLDSSEMLLANVELMRQYATKYSINILGEVDDLIDSYDFKKYIVSSALADIMFNVYYNFSDIDRKCYLGEIKKILAGNLVLDDFLSQHGVLVCDKNLPMIADDVYHKSLAKKRSFM
ncbi:MAG: hypothetical protein J6B89_00530 [Bacilli bacterium]|nr:hypothetical protein [Bacilli bacterium]